MLNVYAGCIDAWIVICCGLAQMLWLDFTPVNGGTGDGNAEFLPGWFAGFTHVISCRLVSVFP